MNTETMIEPQEQGLAGQNVIQLPYGLLGFERVKNYVLLTNPQEEPFLWLRMLDSTRKAFLVVSPFLIMPDYQPDIPTDDVEFLGLTEPEDALLYNICTLRGPGRATINLKGPIVINRHTLVGKQVIPNNAAQYALNHPLPVS
ncbi:MAG TPA: flagellar assembly protein FliW [Candidatus Saccharimonadales bacterium]|nr:flagellar assembly protein FliW [Candidatus Saccharimonadales bacterium]